MRYVSDTESGKKLDISGGHGNVTVQNPLHPKYPKDVSQKEIGLQVFPCYGVITEFPTHKGVSLFENVYHLSELSKNDNILILVPN